MLFGSDVNSPDSVWRIFPGTGTPEATRRTGAVLHAAVVGLCAAAVGQGRPGLTPPRHEPDTVCAACCSGPRNSFTICFAVCRCALPLMFIAAMICPRRLRIGADNDIRPTSSSWSTTAQPCWRTCAIAAFSSPRSVIVRGVCARDAALRERLVGFGVVERGQQHAAHRRAVRGQPAANRQVDRHDLAGRHAQHVDDLGAVEHGRRAARGSARTAVPSRDRRDSRTAST